MNQKVVLIILVVVLLAVGSVVFYAITKKEHGTQENIKESPVGSGDSEIIPVDNVGTEFNIEDTEIDGVNISDWKTYRNEEYGFELKYPGDFTKQKTVSDNDLLYLRKTESGSNIYISIRLRKDYQINKITSSVVAKEIKIADQLGYKYFYHEGVGYSGVVLIQLGQDALQLIYDLIGPNKDNKISKEAFVENNLDKILSTFKFTKS